MYAACICIHIYIPYVKNFGVGKIVNLANGKPFTNFQPSFLVIPSGRFRGQGNYSPPPCNLKEYKRLNQSIVIKMY